MRRRRGDGEQASPKITILLVHAWGMGGTIRSALSAAEHLAKSHQVEVLSLWRTEDEPFFPFPPGVAVVTVDDRREGAAPRLAHPLRARRGRLLYPGDRTSLRTSLWTDLQLLRRLRAARPGIIIGTRPALNFLLANVHAAAVVATEHAPYSVYTPWIQDEIRRCYGTLDAVVVLTEHERRRFKSVLGRGAPVFAIPNAAPPPRAPSAHARRPVVLAAGRLCRAKGFDRLIPAFAEVVSEHPGWQLRICGDGAERPALERLIAELGVEDDVRLLGRVADIEREMDEASIFALSSRREGMPMAMLEAMARGLAVVAFRRTCGPGEILDHGVDGLLVERGDQRALARSIAALIDDERLRRRLGTAAARKAAEYGPGVVGERWDILLGGLAGGRDRRSSRARLRLADPRRVLRPVPGRQPGAHESADPLP